MMFFSQPQFMKRLVPVLVFASLHFGVTLLLYFMTTSPPPDYDMVEMVAGVQRINQSARYALYNIVAPTLYVYHWNKGHFYAGPIWWAATLLVSLIVGVGYDFVHERVIGWRKRNSL